MSCQCGIVYDKETARKEFKAVAGDRVTHSCGLVGTVWDVRPTVINFKTGEVSTSYTIILDKIAGIACWPVHAKIDDFELLEEK